jgi:hypothetical protein
MARKIEIATLLADADLPIPHNADHWWARVEGYMDSAKENLIKLATDRGLTMTPTQEVWFERDGAAVPGGSTGETWFAVYDVPAGIPGDMFDGREDLALSYDDCPRFFTDAGRSAAAVEPNGSSTTPA